MQVQKSGDYHLIDQIYKLSGEMKSFIFKIRQVLLSLAWDDKNQCKKTYLKVKEMFEIFSKDVEDLFETLEF